MLQSIVDLCNRSYEDECWKEVETMFWILSKIDTKKLIDRVWTAMDDPTKQTKVVLCEYNYTTKHSVESGHPNVVDRLPNGVLVHDAMYREDFVTLMNQMFCLNDKIVWYRRRKVTREGLNDIHRMQVVLLFKEGAFPEPVRLSTETPIASPVLPSSPPRLVRSTSDDSEWLAPRRTLTNMPLPENDTLECRECSGAHWTVSCPTLCTAPASCHCFRHDDEEVLEGVARF
jgi:hypothetical protein